MAHWSDCYGPLVGRILVGGFFFWSGILDLLNLSTTTGLVAAAHVPAPGIVTLLAILIDIAAGLGLILGYKTRISALVLVVYFTLTTILFHADFTDPTQTNFFIENIAIIGGLLYMSAHGSGHWSMDHKKSAHY